MLVPHVYAIVDLTKIDWRSVKYCYCKGPGYSVLYPATNSASASDKSNGARFVSATHVYAETSLGQVNKSTYCYIINDIITLLL